MLKIRSFIYLIPFILVYLCPALGITLPDTRVLYIVIFIVPIILFTILIFNTKSTTSYLKLLYKKTPMRYFIFLYLWLIFTSFIAAIKGYYSFNYFIVTVMIGVFFRCFLLYTYPTIIFPKYIRLRTLIKFFLGVIYIVLIIGIVEFIASTIQLQPVLNILYSIANTTEADRILIDSHSNIPRIKALTSEPSALAGMIIAFLPFIYNLSNCKYRIYNNKIINAVVKNTIVPLAVFCLILTQSPIGLIFAICVTIYVYYKKILNFTKKHFSLVIIPILLIGSFVLTNNISGMDTSDSYLIRIVNVVTSIMHGNFDEFVSIEQSLATRVLNWINQYQLFIKHPIVGVGFMNKGWVLIRHLQSSNFPFTYEMMDNMRDAVSTIDVNMTTSSQLLYQTGLIGLVLYVTYMLKCIKYLRKISNFFSSLNKVFIISFKQYFVFVFVNSMIYGAGFMNSATFFAMGIVNGLIILALINKEQYIKQTKNNSNGG